MIPHRYDAPVATTVLGDEQRMEYWRKITDAYALEVIDERNLNDDTRRDELYAELEDAKTPTPEQVATREQETGHDVVAFLSMYTQQMIDELKPYIHHGLTSSDLVEYGLFQGIGEHAAAMSNLVTNLMNDGLSRWQGASTVRPGRTHGQIADTTSWSHQMFVVWDTMNQLRSDLDELREVLNIVKSPGPTGWPGSDHLRYGRGKRVADILDAELVPATQVVHRERLLRWACVYLRLSCTLENLALQVRLSARSEIQEVRESSERVGSSAMPHKQNPIGSEKVCGLARVARGYFTAISEDVALWEDRDLTNSGLERIAVPGLAAIVEHMLFTMTNVMKNLSVDTHMMAAHATDERAKTNVMQIAAQDALGLGPIEAGRLIREGIEGVPVAAWWVREVSALMTARGHDGGAWEREVSKRWIDRFREGRIPTST